MGEIRVAVVGAAGRMGTQTCQAIDAVDDLELVARIDANDPLSDAQSAGAEVMVDFTEPGAVLDNIRTGLGLGLHCVVGTSGFDDKKLATVREMLTSSPEAGVVIAPNFALGAVLLMRFAREAAPFFESAEVVELHHPDKLDAPSGTAVHTAESMAHARHQAGVTDSPDATSQGQAEARGALVDGVRIHSVRLRGLVAHEEVLLGNAGEQLTIRHDSFDRAAFMPGVLLAIRSVVQRPGLTVGLEPLLDLE